MTTTVRQIWTSFGEIDKRCCETKYLLYFFYCVVFLCSVVSNSCTNSSDKVNTNAGGLGDFVIGLMRIYFVFRRNISKFTRPCGHTRRNKPIFLRILVKFDGF